MGPKIVLKAVVASLLVAAPLVLWTTAAEAGVGVGVAPDFPSVTTVGDTFGAGLDILNASTPPESAVPITITSITIAPGCSVNGTPNCAGGVDAGVFTLGAVGTGANACAGIQFAIAPAGPGLYNVVPLAPVVLDAGETCRINFLVTTSRVPTVDTQPAMPGIQTLVFATVGVTSPAVPGNVFIGTGGDLVTVNPAPTTIETTATPARVDVNEPFSDVAVVTGVPNGPPVTGTVVFQLYGPATPPGFPDCTTPPAFTSAPVPLTAGPPGPAGAPTATAGSGPVTTAIPGNYVFVATFTPAAGSSYTGVTSPCQDPDERVAVEALPTINVDKTATPLSRVEPGGVFTFNVQVTNTSAEPVTITALTDDIYGNIANQGTCTTAVGTVLASAPGPGNTYSCAFPGSFTGLAPASQTDIVTATAVDADGNQATDTDDAVVTLTPSQPVIVVDKTATPLSRPEPGGLFTFNVVVTNNSVRPVTITSLTDNIYGNLATQGSCVTAVGTVLAAAPGPGNTYGCSFTGSFFGNAGASQTDVVTATAVDSLGQPASDSDDAVVTLTNVPPTINVDKSATPASLPEPGGSFTFNVVVTNTSAEPVTITSLTDDIYGNLATQGTCTTAIGTVLAASPGPGNTYSCSFVGAFNGNANASQTDVVTATVVDDDGSTATDTDDATVTLTNVLPTILVDKTAVPLSRPEPGGSFTFNVVVTNTSAEPVTITSLTDDIYGNLATQGTCTTAIGTVLAASPGPGNTYSCSFTGSFSGNAGASQTDIVTATAVDDDGSTATDTDDAVVTLTNVLPTILVDKTATPTTRLEPGGAFTFNVVVTNTSIEPVTITSLTDDIYGNLATQGSCITAVGTVLAASPGPGNTYSCAFTGSFTGNAGAQQTDTVTATAVDDEGSTATDTDDATVAITNVVPTILVDKTAAPGSRPEPGGTFTFNVVVTNISIEPVTITSLTDDIYGNIATQGTCTTAIGTVLPASGGTYTCSFSGPFNGNAGASQTDIVTAIAVDDDGTTATDTDDATVTLTNVLPTIQVVKTANPLTRSEPGGAFTFSVVVTNTSIENLTITSLTDNIYGDLATQGTCSTAVGTVLAPNGTYGCAFSGSFTGNAGATQTDIVTVTGVDDDGSTATDTDDAVVAITNVAPTVLVDKTATPLTRPEPGGSFTFNVVVTNTSAEPVTITTLTDDIYGNLATQGTCTTAIGTVLTASPGPGNTYGCSFTGSFTGNAGASQTDIVTTVVTDDDGSTASDTDDAVVSLTNVLPTVQVVKTATPLQLPEPGGTFTFNVVVTNTSAEAVTITTLTDDIYGNLATQGTCTTAIGTVLQPAGTYSCSFTGSFTGPGTSQTDVVTVVVTDDDNTTATDTDDATVTLTNVLPTIQVDKTAAPVSLPEPGGTFTFSVVVTNTSNEPVTITTLTDDIYGNLATQGTCTTAIGTVLTASPGPGNTYSCSFPGDFTGNAGDDQVDIVTATAVDNEGSTATDTDDATVAITDVEPSVLVDKTATPETQPIPGGAFTFTVVVTNTSDEALTITTLTDDIYGNIATQGSCTTAIGTVLDPAESYTCSFTGSFTGTSAASQTDIVTVTATDDDGNTATDTDDAIVRLTVPPATVLQQQTVSTVPDSSVATRSTPAAQLPRTGAGVADLTALAAGLLGLGSFLLVTASRWGRTVPAAAAAGVQQVLALRSRRRAA